MPLDYPRAAAGYATEFSTSALPWVTSSVAPPNTPQRIDFPTTTKFITISNVEPARSSSISFGFTLNNVVSGTNKFTLKGGDSVTLDDKTTSLFIRSDSSLGQSYTLCAGLTTVDKRYMPVFSETAIPVPISLGADIWLRADLGIANPVTGALVPLWLDQSGNGNHAIQNTGSMQPSYVENVANGIPGVKWNLTANNDMQMFIEGKFPLQLARFTIYIIGYMKDEDQAAINASGIASRVLSSNTSPNIMSMTFYESNTTKRALSTILNVATATATIATPTNTFLLLGHYYNGNLNRIGRLANNLVGANLGYATPTTRLVLGNAFLSNKWSYQGVINEFVFFNRQLSPNENALMIKYFAQRYNVAWT